MSTVICIPSRIGSTRVKEKMLIEFEGKPLIRHVFDSVEKFGYDTVVLTDSKKISNLIPKENVLLTSEHENGTARISSVINELDYDNYLNIQGDMLGVSKSTISPLLDNYTSGMMTAYKKGYKPGSVKVIHQNSKASWFTRHDIGYGDQHLGVYMYDKEVLQNYSTFKGADNNKESLEQLRVLRYFPMYVVESSYNGREINTPQDVYESKNNIIRESSN